MLRKNNIVKVLVNFKKVARLDHQGCKDYLKSNGHGWEISGFFR